MGEEIKEIKSKALGRNYKRKDIKNKAADMVLGIDQDDMASYNPESSKKNKLLNKFYNKYKDKYDKEKFLNLTPEEVKELPSKDQERWFAAKNTQQAGPILGAIAAVSSAPFLIGQLATAPIATTTGIIGTEIGSKIGGNIGKKIDERRHNLTNAEATGSVVGGVIGGMAGLFPKPRFSRNLPVTQAQKDLANKIFLEKNDLSKFDGIKNHIWHNWGNGQIDNEFIKNNPAPIFRASKNAEADLYFDKFIDHFGFKSDYNSGVPQNIEHAVSSGIDDAINFASSDAVNNAVRHNEQLFARAKFKPSTERSIYTPRVHTPTVRYAKFGNANYSGLHLEHPMEWPANRDFGGILINTDGINENVAKMAAFHETNHDFLIGMPKTENGAAAYRWKVKKALIPEEIAKQSGKIDDYNYLLQPGEAVVNFAEIGNSLGIQPGQTITLNDWINYVNRARIEVPTKAGYLDLINPKKWYRGAQLLNGTYKKGGKLNE